MEFPLDLGLTRPSSAWVERSSLVTTSAGWSVTYSPYLRASGSKEPLRLLWVAEVAAWVNPIRRFLSFLTLTPVFEGASLKNDTA